MAEQSQSISQELYSILGLGAFSKIRKQLVSKCHYKKNSASKKVAPKGDPKSTKEECKAYEYSNYNHVDENGIHMVGSPDEEIFKHPNHENNYFTQSPQSASSLSRTTSSLNSRNASPLHSRSISPSPLSRNGSEIRNQTLMHAVRTSLFRNMSKKNSSFDSSVTSSLSRSMSRRSNSTMIMYSNSNGVVKPPAMEKTLDCTLEELCFGCIKKIKTTRNAITNYGQITEEEEVLKIKVKPGWKNGTKITFEGKGNETPSSLSADIIFTIAEKEHHLFKREGNDLELDVKISLMEALTGCTLPIPLLGGKQMSLTMDDIIHPGQRKIITGQGMAKPQEEGQRGNLIITFLVEFPIELTEQQRSDIISILQGSF